MVGRGVVAFGEEGGVGVQGGPRLAVAEAVGDGAKVVAGADHLGGGEVSQVVETCPRQPALRATRRNVPVALSGR